MADERHTPTDQGENGAKRVLTDIGDIGAEFIAAVRDGAAHLLDEQRQHAANEITALGEVLRRSVQSLNEAASDTVTQYTDQAVSRIDGLADTVRQRTWSEMAGDIENFARRWPVAFVASAAGLGFVAGRFMTPSAVRPVERGTLQSAPARSGGAGKGARVGAQVEYGADDGVPAGAKSGLGAGAAGKSG
jgi:ElaB/YqjD/DUF883 family membrane-anchored ribosome-binding protein